MLLSRDPDEVSGTVDPVGTIVLKTVRHRRRTPLSESMLYDYPFFRVTPSGLQVGLGRDLVVSLGSPSHVVWQTFPGPGGRIDKIRIQGSAPQDSAFVVTYMRGRPSGLTTLPIPLRKILRQGRYYALALPNTNAWPRYVDFPTQPGVRAVPAEPNKIRL